MTSRRHFLKNSLAGAVAVGAGLVARSAAAAIPAAHSASDARTQAPAGGDLPYTPVTTLNGWTLPYRMNKGVKEFHLVAEPVRARNRAGHDGAPVGLQRAKPGPHHRMRRRRPRAHLRYQQVAGTHRRALARLAAAERHGRRRRAHAKADPVGKTFVYEFDIRKSGTFMYHPHADEMVQMAMGMMGMFIVHPAPDKKQASALRVDRDYAFLLAAYDIDPGSYTPRVNTMTEFNIWTWNSRVFPGIDALVARTGEKVRIRVGNLTMTNHPIHLHGHVFEVAGTDGGWVPKNARWPEVTTDIAVGQMRAIELVADAPGDWAFHCHKSHHTMNAMGHGVPNLIGVEQRDLAKKMRKLLPGYTMPMGSEGMAEMGDMQMALPENTLPMMTGTGPFGPLEMGGMFAVFKVRDDQPRGDYRDPGWYRHPAGTVAHEWEGSAPEPVRAAGAAASDSAVNVVKPGQHSGH
jgi:hypothetical protein